jgi:hypothetical protein
MMTARLGMTGWVFLVEVDQDGLWPSLIDTSARRHSVSGCTERSGRLSRGWCVIGLHTVFQKMKKGENENEMANASKIKNADEILSFSFAPIKHPFSEI